MKLAIYVITENAVKLGARLKKTLSFADLFISEKLKAQCDNALPLSLPLGKFVADKFAQYDGHIFICATGIVTRLISPLINDKKTDPAVVCLDEQASFVISLLSGHRGGANELTQRVAHIVKATPVITTASDVSQSVSVDMLGAPFGWVLDPLCESAITTVSAAVVNSEPVIIAQDAGDKIWWKYDKRMPRHIICHDTLYDIDSCDFAGGILISDKKRPCVSGWENKLVVWHPKSLVLGIGCDRNTPLSTFKVGLAAFSEKFNLSLDSVSAIASIDLKADEVGLLQLSQEMQWPYHTYPADQLDGIEGIETPSDYVKKVTGSNSVAEAAALKLSDTHKLVVAKWAFKLGGFNMTIACCRKVFSESLIQQKRKNRWGEKKHGDVDQPIKINAHGNEVVDGYQCKPMHVDLDRPMLNYRHHILLCEGKRCAQTGTKNLAHDLRGLLKEMGLSKGNQRIKISRTLCVGACRNRSTMVIYERINGDPLSVNNGLWLRKIEAFTEAQWRTLFTTLAENRPVHEVLDAQFIAAVESPSEEKVCG